MRRVVIEGDVKDAWDKIDRETGKGDTGRNEEKKRVPPPDHLLEHVTKFIPVEVVASFVFADGVLASVTDVPNFVPRMVFAGFLLCAPLLSWFTWQKD